MHNTSLGLPLTRVFFGVKNLHFFNLKNMIFCTKYFVKKMVLKMFAMMLFVQPLV
jgi:hypothetical protein